MAGPVGWRLMQSPRGWFAYPALRYREAIKYVADVRVFYQVYAPDDCAPLSLLPELPDGFKEVDITRFTFAMPAEEVNATGEET